MSLWARLVRGGLTAALALVLVALLAGTAAAHAEVVRSDPAAGAVVPAAPRTLRIWFSEPVEAPPNAIVVTGPDGSRADQGNAGVAPDDATALIVSLNTGAQGTYTVQWRAVSADSHPVSGSFQFSVGAPSAAAPPVEAATSTGVPWQAAARWLHLLGLVVALGPLVFRLLVLGSAGDRALDARLWRLARVGTLVLVIAAPLMALAQAVGVGGSLGAAVDPEVLRSLMRSGYGARWLLRAALAWALLVLAVQAVQRGRRARLGRSWPLAGLAMGAVLLLLTSLNGHPAATNPVWLSVLVDWVHLAATIAWVGGLLALVVCVRPALRERPAEQQARLLGSTAPRFSTVALVAVELLVVSGLYATWAHVASPSALTSSDYGRALLVKLGLVAVTLGFGAINLLVIRPRMVAAARIPAAKLEDVEPLARRFARVIGAEAVLGVAILAVVGVLTSLPPASAPPAAAAGPQVASAPALTLAQNAGPTLVTLSVDPARPGSNQLAIRLTTPMDEPVTEATVRVRVRPAGGSGAAAVSTAAPADGGFRATVMLAPAGAWHLEVLVTLPGQAEATAPFDLTVPVPDVRGLLALSDARMNQLHSLVEDNELTDGGAVVKTRYTYEAPGRIHFVINTPQGQTETIGIDRQRWEREGDGPWQQSPWPGQDPYRWPAYHYAELASEASLLGQERLDGVDCFVVAFYDPDSGARFRVWIGTEDYLLRKLVMMAPAHYMTSVFSGFNMPVAIEAPAGAAGG